MQVGNKVVCINDRFSPEIVASYFQLPRMDETYTVRSVYLGRSHWISKGKEETCEVGILLEELHNPSDLRVKGGPEMGFNSERFRIVEEVAIKHIKVEHGKED